jgi:hypothetical protein
MQKSAADSNLLLLKRWLHQRLNQKVVSKAALLPRIDGADYISHSSRFHSGMFPERSFQ